MLSIRRKLLLPVALIALLLCLLLMLASSVIVGGGAGSSTEEVLCLPPTATGASGPLPSGSAAQQQIGNAKLIDKTAQQLGLSGHASYLAIVTAVGESDLINIDEGDAKYGVTNPDGTPTTSFGLFQQQTSTGWGTHAQVMDPTYATTSFLLGPKHDGKGGLVSVPGWETRPATDVIHAVQRNADPTYYATKEARAREIIKIAGIDVNRAATAAGNRLSPAGAASIDPDAAPLQATSCGNPGAPTGAAASLALTSGPCPAGAADNGTTCDKAITYMTQQMDSGSRDWHRWCLRLVSESYGGIYSGIPSAFEAGELVQSRGLMQPPTKDYASIPRGAVLWYDGRVTGNEAGHVALSIGNGMALSNDVPINDGRVGIVPISFFEDNWGQRFMGWSPPRR